MPSPEQLIELTFPLQGQDSQREFQLQPADTTPIAINVRSIDPIENRNRGASRPGIRKYVDQKLGLFSLIQHLNVIVDPSIDATLSDGDSIVQISDPLGGLYPPAYPDGGPHSRVMRRDTDHWMPRGGSGVVYRNGILSPRAVDDTISADPGGAAVIIQPLSNDFYSGAATFAVVATSTNFRGTYAVAGPIGGWDFTYTPPALPSPSVDAASTALQAAITAGAPPSQILQLGRVLQHAVEESAARTMLVSYTLKALGNKGTAVARIRINLSAVPADGPQPGQTYEVPITAYYYRDGPGPGVADSIAIGGTFFGFTVVSFNYDDYLDDYGSPLHTATPDPGGIIDALVGEYGGTPPPGATIHLTFGAVNPFGDRPTVDSFTVP